MSLRDRLNKLFNASGRPDQAGRYHIVQVRCKRCGEILSARIDLLNDLSPDYDAHTFHARKLVSGSGENRCFQVIELEIAFDQNKRVLEQRAAGAEIATST